MSEISRITKKVKVRCPRCGNVGYTPISLVGNAWPIDDAKCSICFDDGVFINLERVSDKELLYGKENEG